MEIERRWLVNGWPEGTPAQVWHMAQGYFAVRPAIRIRRRGQLRHARGRAGAAQRKQAAKHGQQSGSQTQSSLPGDLFRRAARCGAPSARSP